MWKNKVGPLYPFIISIIGVLIFLSAARSIHTWLYFDHISQISQLRTIFIKGVRIDLVICVYLFAIPILLFATLHTYFKKSIPNVSNAFIYWMLGAFLVLGFMEAVTPLYILEYGSRPERKFFEYLGHPKEVLTMLAGTYGFAALMIFTVLAVISPVLLFVLKCVFTQPAQWTSKQYLVLMPIVLLVLIVCGRSSFDHRAINPSMIAFTDDVLLNNLPMNSLYSVIYAAYRVKDEEDVSKMYGKLTDDEVKHYVYDNHPTRLQTNDVLPLTLSSPNKKNVVIILEESLGARFVERLGGEALTPNLNKLAEEGWWFTNLYATGTRSVRGIEAVTTGFLPTPGRSVVKLSSSQSNFFTLASLLKNYEYTSRFYYGGSAHFDNMQGFLLGNGFNEVVDQNDYKNPSYSGSWGVSDDDVFTRIHQVLLTKHSPQLLVMLTTSNHTPFDFPVTAEDDYTKPLKSRNNAIRYADKALGKFIDRAKQSEYWNDTIFLIVADHDLRVADFITAIDSSDKSKTNKIFPVEGFHIPGLILGGGITPKVTSSIVSQIDLPTTLLGLLNINDQHPMLGVDLTKVADTYKGRAIMQFHDYQAYINNEDLVVLRPSLEPLTGHYANKVFTQKHVLTELKNKALAHALWARKSYKEQSYHN
jgi:phosphoglycerol transferase MdoB-like AlkP superfamily enzyme